MLKDIPSCIWLLTDLRSKIHQYVPCGIPCNVHLETCGFSPASAGMENATAGSEASRSTEGALQRSLALTPPPAAALSSLPCKLPYGSLGRMAFFPSFSWSGKCDSRERSKSEHRRCVADFPQLQLEWKMRQQGEKRVGAPKVRYPSEFTS